MNKKHPLNVWRNFFLNKVKLINKSSRSNVSLTIETFKETKTFNFHNIEISLTLKLALRGQQTI